MNPQKFFFLIENDESKKIQQAQAAARAGISFMSLANVQIGSPHDSTFEDADHWLTLAGEQFALCINLIEQVRGAGGYDNR